MKACRMICLLALLAATVPGVSADEVEANPMGKVFQLIDELSAKITAEGEAEAKAYKEYFEWCDSTSKETGFEIKTATAKKEKLEATIEKATSAIEASTTKIEELAASLAKDEDELKKAQTIRDKEA